MIVFWETNSLINFVDEVSIYSKENVNVVILKDFDFQSDSANFEIAYIIFILFILFVLYLLLTTTGY